MYFAGLLIISLCLVPDLLVHVYFGDILIKTQFAALFLCFLVLRKKFKYVLVSLCGYALFVAPFSGLGLPMIFFPWLVVLGCFYRLRRDFFTETYLVQSVCVFILFFLHSLLLYLVDSGTPGFVIMPHLMINTIVNAFVMLVFSVPLFMLWDRLFIVLRIHRTSDDRRGSAHIILNGKRKFDELL
ncbi:MAG: hypothetical protein HQM16_11260 [Deltaproteobacteria bacterium]|nr:hypothetical protein [Deltaproteobacteria bacterium]